MEITVEKLNDNVDRYTIEFSGHYGRVLLSGHYRKLMDDEAIARALVEALAKGLVSTIADKVNEVRSKKGNG